MKVIAETANGVMLEASKEEIALILGFRNMYADGFKSDMVKIGKEIPIVKIDKVSRFVRTLEKDKLMHIKDQLTLAINGIDAAADAVSEVTLFATLAEDEK